MCIRDRRSAAHPDHVKLGLHQSARLEQRLLQSPQMIQAMQILQMPALDLEARIQQELVENPFLELEDGSSEASEGGEKDGLDASNAQELTATLTKDEKREEAGVEN